MALLADIERFLERVFERSAARVFRSRVQAVQVEHRVERAMERARLVGGGRTSVPDRYRVRLAPADLASAAADVGGAEVLAARLADAALAFARAHGYHLPGRPMVSLVADPSVTPGEIEVDAVAGERRDASAVPPFSSPSPPRPVPASAAGSTAGSAAEAAPGAVPRPPSAPSEPVTDDASDAGAVGPGPGGIRGDGTHTLVFRRPVPPAARALLRVLAPDGTERTVEVGGAPLSIGRARDNALVLTDARVSRHHGRLQARHGALVYLDAGSTNGSRVNGIRVDEIALGVGDRLELGDTVLVVETLPG